MVSVDDAVIGRCRRTPRTREGRKERCMMESRGIGEGNNVDQLSALAGDSTANINRLFLKRAKSALCLLIYHSLSSH